MDIKLESSVLVLQEEKVILAPSDTVLGLLGVCSEKVFNKLNIIKKRKNKPYLLLAHSLEQVESYVIIPEDMKQALSYFWPGPLTCIFKAKVGAPKFMCSEKDTIAVRVPDHNGLQRLLKRLGCLFSTSANLAGEAIPESNDQISAKLREAVDAVFIDESVFYPQIPSTIVDCTGDEVSVIREGVILKEKVKKYFD